MAITGVAGSGTVNSQNAALSEEEKKKAAQKTAQDYEHEAIQRNWATAQPGSYYSNGNGMQQYTGWNGGSVTGADMNAAVNDSLKYGYDVTLDPRNNAGTREAIGRILLDAQEKANADAIAGNGDYDTNRANYLNQIGWTGDWQNVFKNLQETGKTGLKTLSGQSLEDAYRLGFSGYGKTADPVDEEQLLAQQLWQQQQAKQASYLSPLMNGNLSGRSTGTRRSAGSGTGGAGGAWSYDMENDPVWQAYLKKYSSAAQNGMNDTLGQLSARTGGLASSYAGQAAQQTYDSTMQGATDMIPTLAQNDYDRWLTQRQMETEQQDKEYERQQEAEQTQYERQQAAQQLAAQQQSENADLLLALMQNYGYTPTESELSAAGLSSGMAQSILSGFQNAQSTTGQSGGGSGSRTAGITQTGTGDLFGQMYEAGIQDASTAYSTLLSMYDPDEAAEIAERYAEYLDYQNPVSIDTATPETDNRAQEATEQKDSVPYGAGLNASHFNATVKSIQSQLNAGKIETALNNVDRVLEQTNKAQRESLRQIFEALGYDVYF